MFILHEHILKMYCLSSVVDINIDTVSIMHCIGRRIIFMSSLSLCFAYKFDDLVFFKEFYQFQLTKEGTKNEKEV